MIRGALNVVGLLGMQETNTENREQVANDVVRNYLVPRRLILRRHYGCLQVSFA